MPKSPASAEMPDWPQPLALIAAALSGRALPTLDDAGWDEVARLAVERHRIAGPLLEALAERPIPGRAREALAAEARANTHAALVQKAETVRLLRDLAAAGCRPVLLKGWPLAEWLYGSAGLRHAKDIDLHVGESEIGCTAAALERLGYIVAGEHAARLPALGLDAFRAEYNDLAFVHPATGTEIEVHWRSYHFRGWPELGEMRDAVVDRPLDATGLSVRVPSPSAGLVYLALHGQQHVWLRLKWLLDIDRFARARGAALTGDLAYARAAGAGGAVALALTLASRIFATPLPAGWPRPSRSEARMMSRVLRLMADDGAAPGGLAAKVEVYRAALTRAETPGQRLGVLRYLVWRRLRLGLLRGQTSPT